MKQVVEKRKDVVFYLKMFPLRSIHPQSYNKSKAIYCEKKKSNAKAMALLEDAYAKKQLPEPTCETDVIDKNIVLGQKLGITGTPTLIFQDGRKTSGAMGYDKLVELIDRMKK
jgi:thiol:disulfide interchange protein DsbC